MRSKNIDKQPDYNLMCYDYAAKQPYVLLGGKYDGTEPRRIDLPYYVRLRTGPDVKRELNRWCEGFYSTGSAGEHYWFELLTDAFQARIIYGEPGYN